MKKLEEKSYVFIKTFTNSRILKSFIILGIFFLVSFKASSQQENLTLQLTEVSLETVLNQLQLKTKTDFLYNHEEVNKCPKVSVSIKDGTIEQILEQTLKNTHLEYKKVNNAYIITPKEEGNLQNTEPPKILKQTIRGTVIDRDSKVPIPFANIVVISVNPIIGAISDIDGTFSIKNVPVGRQSLKASFVGFEDAILSEILVGSSKELVLTIELSESITDIEEVEISVSKNEALNEMATISAKSFSVEETQRYAASISDPARMAQSFAGITSGDDASNEIIIRGNSPTWMLWRLEGIEIPTPNHFAEDGGATGAVSILSSNMVGRSDFYTGAFPAEYGSALSGVFDIKLRKGNNQKKEYTFQAGVLGFDFAAEGPFKKDYDGSYLINYRYSTLSVINLMGIKVSGNALPNYQDLAYKLHLPTKKAGSFSIWGIGGLSDVSDIYSPDTSNGEFFDNGYDEFTKTDMYATGITHTYFPDSKSYFKTTVAQTRNTSEYTLKTMDSIGTLYDDYLDNLNKYAIRATTMYNRKLSSRVTARIGATYSDLNYNYSAKEKNEQNIWVKYLDDKGNTQLIQSYFQSKIKLSEKIVATAGVHYAHFALNNDNSVEPRISFTMDLPKKQKIGIGAGMHSKNENLLVYLTEVQKPDGSYHTPNKSLKMTRSNHFIASYENRIKPNTNLKIEAYYQDINNLPVPNNPNKFWAPIFGGTSNNDTLENIGKGKNLGIEITVQKYFADGYYFLITSSIFDSKYKPANGKWMNTKFNTNYINNFVAGKEYKIDDNRIFSINSKIVWNGGSRLTPIDLEASKEKGYAVYKFDQLWAESAKDYFRLDIGARIQFFKPKVQHTISLDIQNVTNRLNTWSLVYDSHNEEIIEFPMAGLIPILNYKLEF